MSTGFGGFLTGGTGFSGTAISPVIGSIVGASMGLGLGLGFSKITKQRMFFS